MSVAAGQEQRVRSGRVAAVQTSTGESADDRAVVFRQVTKMFGDVTALDHVDLLIPRGEAVALLGPNGAGKSTAISLMLGLLDPTDGTVRTVGLAPRDAVAHGRVSAILQSTGLPAGARVAELVEFVRRLYDRPITRSSIIQRAGLTGLERRTVETLSGGELQRVSFALAIAGDPDLLFLDEPTVGMDVETRRGFWSDMRAYGRDGRTVLFATHYLEEADAIADRIMVLNHGKVIADGTARSIKERVPTHIVRFTPPSETATALAAIEAIPAVTSVNVVGDQIQITTTDADAVVAAMVASGLTLRDLEVRGAALEDAFVALTADDRPS